MHVTSTGGKFLRPTDQQVEMKLWIRNWSHSWVG